MHIVNVALPTLSRAFDAPLSDVQWTVIAYLLALAVVIPASGWIGDRIGTKRTFLFALALFTLASALCGAAQSLPQLIAARALQGVGGGLLTPTGTAMLYRAYGPERRARVARTLILPILIGPGMAPILGGVLTQTLSWRWVFLINVPVGIVMVVFTYLFVPEHRPSPAGRLDLTGLLALRLRPQRAPLRDQRGLGARLGLAGRRRGRRRRDRPALALRPAVAAPAGPDPAPAAAPRPAAALDQHRLRPDHRRLPRQPLPDPDLPPAGDAPVADRVGDDDLHRGDRRRGRLADARPALPALRPAGHGRRRRHHPDRLPAALPRRRRLDQPLAGAGADVLRRRRQQRASSSPMQTAMFTHISSADTGHASAIYNTQRQSSIAINIALADHDRRRRRRHPRSPSTTPTSAPRSSPRSAPSSPGP